LYWPDAGSETYGDLVVSLLREDVLASYTLRTFSIRPMRAAGSKKNSLVSAAAAQAAAERTVYQVSISRISGWAGKKFAEIY
jgi:receptor-type tyrosine-protein phosphatase gamma